MRLLPLALGGDALYMRMRLCVGDVALPLHSRLELSNSNQKDFLTLKL